MNGLYDAQHQDRSTDEHLGRAYSRSGTTTYRTRSAAASSWNWLLEAV